ncbi:hypothetical protein DIE06_27640 [Burkholderia sp. Bp8998]|nr:hypothetical protein DIE06_27640 [Burkholderia sp. Bp8998]
MQAGHGRSLLLCIVADRTTEIVRGHRGVKRQFFGVIEFLLTLFFGIGVAVRNPYSDELRG